MSDRRGSTYLVVLGAATLVAIFGLMAIFQERIQRKALALSQDACQARLLAQSAIRIGLLTIATDSSWRETLSQPAASAAVDVNFGTYTLEVTDPYDSDLTDNAEDPVLLTGIGQAGDAVQRVELTLHAKKKPPACLEYALCINDQMLSNTDATIRADRPLSTRTANLDSGNIYADVEAESFSGSTYHAATTVVSSTDRMTVPEVDEVIDYYLDNGTEIDISALPQQTSNLLKNAGMEYGMGHDQEIYNWYPPPNPPNDVHCDLEQTSCRCVRGVYSMRVKNRSDWNAGPVQFIDDWTHAGSTYQVGVWVYSNNSCPFGFAWYTKGTQDRGSWNYSTTSWVPGNSWTYVSTTMTQGGWSGDLEICFIKFRSQLGWGENEFYIDDFTINEITSDRLIYREMIGPNHNPFGGGTNPEGIYVIDCHGQDLLIERSRILGTLVLKNPGSGTQIRSGPIHMAPAVPGYPSLIVYNETLGSNNIAINATRAALSEAANGVNFNPTGAAYAPLGTDADTNDTYPSEIRGLVLVAGDIAFDGDVLVRGALLGNDDLRESHGTLRIEHDPTVLHSPPPGFDTEIEMIAPAGAEKRAVQ